MHSDSWADVPYENMPAWKQAEADTCRQMDAFWAASRANMAAIEAYVESLYQGEAPQALEPASVQPIDDAEIRYLMQDEIEQAHRVMAVIQSACAGDKKPAIELLASNWSTLLGRESKYLAYNKNALLKRYAKNSDASEIARVQGLIDDGEAKVQHLAPRVEWGSKAG